MGGGLNEGTVKGNQEAENMGFGSRVDPEAHQQVAPTVGSIGYWIPYSAACRHAETASPVLCRPHQNPRVSLRDCVTQTRRRVIPTAAMLVDGLTWWTFAGRRAAFQPHGLGGLSHLDA
ncbi:hypothetical protein MAPG_06447 [Magnaporthiopsis poae ATCC 64411]|uniref:Uncharacterized protein n=1 Tax=Magnaporthiopsis poae (strain ATCC 64411 / 73-15) TaxID=644358 RepID=A0A0C4E220_MAGP6|nr:hypothetical protein MAPG_06447 [Magnaporthiopsis poae ATCC 64411]